jgi:hypothetical protein
VYSIEELDRIVLSKRLPKVDKISLKLYCDYFESYIEKNTYLVEIDAKKSFFVKVEAKHVAHIIDLHAFHDSAVRNKKIRFSGAFSKIDGYSNMKKGVITIDTLINSKNGEVWKRRTIRDRVIGFVFIREALLKGRWYSFDKSKCRKDTKLNPKYVASYNVGEIFYNFCISEDDENNCFCISNIVVYKNNSWVENQELLDVSRVCEILSNGKYKSIVCHKEFVKSKLKNKKTAYSVTVDEYTHDKIAKKSYSFNSTRISDNRYLIEYLRIDIINKYIKK